MVVNASLSICGDSSFFISTTSSILQFNVKHIFSIDSNETGSFFPNRANTLKLIPDASFFLTELMTIYYQKTGEIANGIRNIREKI